MHEVGQIMGEGPPLLFNGVWLRKLGHGPSVGRWAIDSRDLAVEGNRIHQHVIAAARAALAEGEGVFQHIFEGKYRTKHRKVHPRFLITEVGVGLTFRHMRNRLGLDKDALMAKLRIAFDRAQNGVVDPPIAEPADDDEIRPPDDEPLFNGDDTVAQLMLEALTDAVPEQVLDPKLSRKINGCIKFLIRAEVGLPQRMAMDLDAWNLERLERWRQAAEAADDAEELLL